MAAPTLMMVARCMHAVAEITQALALFAQSSTEKCSSLMLRAELSSAALMLVASNIMRTAGASGVILSCERCRRQYLPESVEVGMCRDCIQRLTDRESVEERERMRALQEEERRRALQEKASQKRKARERERFHAEMERQRQNEIKRAREKQSSKKKTPLYRRKC